mmetsp:Transcript_14288/g.28825  ORF Transcript_14288/g.28825 Transcript_14288/m.28825 type:complete len:457 (-) Transcript_14288:193-1563(-)
MLAHRQMEASDCERVLCDSKASPDSGSMFRVSSVETMSDTSSDLGSPHPEASLGKDCSIIKSLKLGGKMSLRESIMHKCTDVKQQTAKRPAMPAFVFDIDGVFKNGGKYASFGADALEKLHKARIPYCFMTNGGGGRTETQYAKVMNEKINAFDSKKRNKSDYATEEQMILSYSPFKQHLGHLMEYPVLVVGCPRSLNTAREYGFQKPMHLSEYTRRHPMMNPFGKSGCEKDDKVINGGKETWNENFQAILVFTDPGDFFEAIQVLTDVLLSSRPGEVEYEKNHRIPIVFSNPDLLWKTQYAHPRFGQGAFRLSLEACYKARMEALGISSEEIATRMKDFIQFGKPYNPQFIHARNAVLKQADNFGCNVAHFYMVGDNPRSDIRGAVAMNELAEEKELSGWSGLLVRTGVWQDGDDKMGASEVFDDVVAAVDHVLKTHASEIETFGEFRGPESADC